jgi:hypothetical protein
MPTGTARLDEQEIITMAKKAFATLVAYEADEGTTLVVEDLYQWGDCVPPEGLITREVHKAWDMNEFRFKLALKTLIEENLGLVPESGQGVIRLLFREETAPLMEKKAVASCYKAIRTAMKKAQVPDIMKLSPTSRAERHNTVARLALLEGHVAEIEEA